MHAFLVNGFENNCVMEMFGKFAYQNLIFTY